MSRFESGTWNPWLSLGRPWVCDPGIAECSNLTDAASGSNLAPVYQPIKPIAGSNPAIMLGYFTQNSNNPNLSNGVDTDSINDGLSIASEPVVASYMDNNKVFANMGGTTSGAPLTISSVSIAGGTNVTVTFAEDPATYFTNTYNYYFSPSYLLQSFRRIKNYKELKYWLNAGLSLIKAKLYFK